MHALMLLCALVLDALFGEPEWVWSRVPHPVKLIGKLVQEADDRFNRGSNRRARGVAVIAALTVAALILGAIIAALPGGGLLEVVGAAILLSHKSLIDHVTAVADGLRVNLSEGRREVARIVGRDVDGMEEGDVARAAIESAAENLSDGVVAPAFWFLLLGLPGILAYKVINTADSMIGHRTERHEEFGMGAARLDDAVNWIPARLTCLLIALSNGVWSGFRSLAGDAALHRSPNAGWPEAAIAAVLNIALSGPRSYDGVRTEQPYVNEDGRKELNVGDVYDALAALKKAWIGLCAVCLVLYLLW